MKKRAIVVGSGIAGIATAIRLSQQNYEVSVYEANAYPGGKLSQFNVDGYRFDAGPSLFTMPQLVEELFALCGENVHDHFQYRRMDEGCRYFFEDGTRFTAPGEESSLIEAISDTFGEDRKVVRRFFRKSRLLYELTAPVFLESSLHKVSTYLRWTGIKGILNLWRLKMFSTMDEVNRSSFRNPKTVQIFNRYATYNGSNPFKAPATLNVIPHLETGYGVFLPEKGMYSITESLYQLALRQGVRFHFNSKVDRILIQDKKTKGVCIKEEIHEADLVVSNMDVFNTYEFLLKDLPMPEKVKAAESSSSALIFYWGMKADFPELGLHNIFFARDYKKEFESIFGLKTVYPDPTVYINITSKQVKADAPDHCENWFVMINVPANEGQDWEVLINRARLSIIEKLSRILKRDIRPLIANENVLDPVRIEKVTSSYKGALYGTSSNNRMSAFMRHPNFRSDIDGLYFCGGSVHPGGGIPLCLLSARIVSELVR